LTNKVLAGVALLLAGVALSTCTAAERKQVAVDTAECVLEKELGRRGVTIQIQDAGRE
jgi:hypothetical protein